MISAYLLTVALAIIYVRLLIRYLALFQQEHYDVRKFLFHAQNYYWSDFRVLSLYLVFILIYIDLNAVINWLAALFTLALAFIFDKMVIGLKLTKRIIRFLITYIFLITFECWLLHFITNFAIIGFLITFMLPLDLMITSYLNYPVEKIIGFHFIRVAQKKLAASSSLLKIGITGSFGKTTTKNILGSILSTSYVTLATPASYNTPMGLSKCINQDLRPETEIFIAEMGAFRPGEIRYLSEMVKPEIGIVTAVGPQHLSTFKTVANVLKTKMELLEALPEHGIGIINADNEYIRNFKGNIRCRMVSIGITDEEADYQAKNIRYKDLKMTFDIYHKGSFVLKASSRLLGSHNVYNLLIAIACALELSEKGFPVAIPRIIEGIERMDGVPHRLKLEQRGKMVVLDDSYNANLTGFLGAIEVVSQFTGTKLLITPGIVDAGKHQTELNRRVASSIVKTFDEVYLINNPATRDIGHFFEEVGFPKYRTYPRFQDAYVDVLNKYQNQEVVLLIENDLPDNFLERK